MKKTWNEKLNDSKDFPKVFNLEPAKAQKFKADTMLIPAPLEVDELMRRVPKGKLTTIAELRRELARRHKADISCPMVTGIFAWIAAHAANEAAAEGKKRITPYWRTLKAGGELNIKYPGGITAQTEKLTSEGHCVVQRGKKFFVENYEAKLT